MRVKPCMTKKRNNLCKRKIIILGIDGLSPNIIEPLMKAGKLPHFTRLKKTGSYRKLSTTNPPQSPVVWTAIATGKNPGEFGIFDFIRRNPATYRMDLSISNIQKRKASRVVNAKRFWDYTSQRKIPTVILHYPLTFPPERVCGRMLSGMGVPDILETEGTFIIYTSKVPGKQVMGGVVVYVRRQNHMRIYLQGPLFRDGYDSRRRDRVAIDVIIDKKRDRAVVIYQGKQCELKPGKLSEWHMIEFNVGTLRKAKGILRFHLISIEPEFTLYVSPVNFDPRDPLYPISYPNGYSRHLSRHIGFYYTQGMPVDTWAANEGWLSERDLLYQTNEVFHQNRRMLDYEYGRFRQGVFVFYLGILDAIQHTFWRHIDSKRIHCSSSVLHDRETIPACYQEIDNLLGSIIERMEKNDSLMVISDHGFTACYRSVHLNSWLRNNGYLILKSPKASAGAQLLKNVDWTKTKAYAIGFGGIYINQKGREGAGIVMPGREAECMKKEISKKLLDWFDEKNKQPIVHRVYNGKNIFRGKYVNAAPDLFIGLKPGYRISWQTGMGGVPDALVEDNRKTWSGDHLVDSSFVPGVIFTNIPGIKSNPSIYDIAPTILKSVGYSEKELRKEGFEGKLLF